MPLHSDLAEEPPAGALQMSPHLANHFLIAMPAMHDEMFGKSVVFICEHSERGALGLVINKPADLSMKALFDKIDLPLHRHDLLDMPVFQGGPVHTERGFVLHDRMSQHDADMLAGISGPSSFDQLPAYASSLFVANRLEVTTSKDVLEALADGAGPKRVLVALGYSAWAAGQLESEIAENDWLSVPVSDDMALIFDTPAEQRYQKALAMLGIEEVALSSWAGHA